MMKRPGLGPEGRRRHIHADIAERARPDISAIRSLPRANCDALIAGDLG